MMYDYLLVVGPGRSGSDFLYQNLKNHPAMVFPEIKEGRYYKSPRRFRGTIDQLNCDTRRILVDITTRGYRDLSLIEGIRAQKVNGYRILIIVLLRDHLDRALSAMLFRKSRGERSALFGMSKLEDAVVRDRLTKQNLLDIYELDVDVLAVHFSTLTNDTEAVLEVLASLCGTSEFGTVERLVINESVRARNILFSAFGKAVAIAMRKLGFKRLLQRVKDNQSVKKLFFVQLSEDEDKLTMSEKSTELLKTSFSECCSIIENASDKIREGIYFRRTSSPSDRTDSGSVR